MFSEPERRKSALGTPAKGENKGRTAFPGHRGHGKGLASLPGEGAFQAWTGAWGPELPGTICVSLGELLTFSG